ncbi:retrotransposon ORF1, partial [Tanacetum coccineum]
DHAGCLDIRKSTSDGIQFLGGDKLVSWSSKKQDCTSMSTAKDEYVALSACCAQVLCDTDFKAATYKRGLTTLEGQIVKYREHEVLFSEEIALLKRSVESVNQIEKPIKRIVKYAEMYRSQKPKGNQRNWNNLKSQQLGNEFVMNNKTCFACGSFNHLIKDCKRKVQKPIWNNARRVNHHNSHRMSYPHPKRNFVPKAVLMKTRMRPVNAAKPKAAYNAVKRNRFNAVKASACCVWMPKNRVMDCTAQAGRVPQEKENPEKIVQKQKTKKMKWEIIGRVILPGMISTTKPQPIKNIPTAVID